MAVEEIFIVNQAEKFKKLEELLFENRKCCLWLCIYLGKHRWYVFEERKNSPPPIPLQANANFWTVLSHLLHIWWSNACVFNTLITISHCQLYCCIQSECPTTPPSVDVLCVAPAGAVDCHYKRDLCCCGHCLEKFTFSCKPDSTTGAGVWKAKHLPICPAEGCGDEGAMLVL